ncbi:MAG: adenine phosphoribosyltransferase [Deltaproteobacteria bacterium]|nr:adenine phosphoribosyltransferase [Deltaproteobacteria bacterium]
MENMIKEHVRDIPDFPKPGIVFKDITPLLKDAEVLRKIVEAFAERYRAMKPHAIVGIESRGFLFGVPLAQALGIGFVPARKQGKLPYKTIGISYDLEYGQATIEMHVDAVNKGERVVVIDDLLATGGTAGAACALVQKCGGSVVECAFVVELGFLHGRDQLKRTPVYSLANYV